MPRGAGPGPARPARGAPSPTRGYRVGDSPQETSLG